MKKDTSKNAENTTEAEEIVDDITFEEETDADMVGSKSSFGTGGEDTQLQKLKKKLKESEQKAKENMDGWQRMRADAANNKKAEAERLSGAKSRGAEAVLESLLPALDSFDSAMQGASWESIDEAWRMGMEFVHNQLISALEEHGVTSFGKVGDAVDTALHELSEGSDANGKTITKVLRSGYKNGDKIIRAAKVVV